MMLLTAFNAAVMIIALNVKIKILHMLRMEFVYAGMNGKNSMILASVRFAIKQGVHLALPSTKINV